MKKILTFFISLVVLIVLTTAVQAQRAVLMPLVAGDTIVNTATVNKAMPVMTAGYEAMAVQVVVTKISGTVAGTVTPQVSLDNTNWITLPGGSAYTNTDITTNSTIWYFNAGVPWQYFRLKATGSGTMSAVMRLYYTLRPVAR